MEIIVYSKTVCPWCTVVKNYLDNNGVIYEERNIDKNEDWRADVLDMGYAGVPVVVKTYEKDAPHGRVRESMTGFNPEALDKLLKDFE